MLNIFFIALASANLIQTYAVMNLQWRVDPATNRTGFVFVFTEHFQLITSIAMFAYISSKETRVIRSAVLVCLVYIVCFTPNVCIVLASIIEPRLYIADPYFGPFVFILLYFASLFQVISSACNIFIYLTTIIRLKNTFRIIVCCLKD